MGMFEVDKAGLAQILARRGVQFAVLELIQNALDESGVKKISVCLLKSETRGYFYLTVIDDAPEGFADLHSREKTAQGSVISVEIKMTVAESQETERAVKRVILPGGVELFFNDWKLPERWHISQIVTNLPTERADEEGYLRPTRRDTFLRTRSAAGSGPC